MRPSGPGWSPAGKAPKIFRGDTSAERGSAVLAFLPKPRLFQIEPWPLTKLSENEYPALLLKGRIAQDLYLLPSDVM